MLALLLAASLLAAPVLAVAPVQAACPLPAGLAGWARPVAIDAGVSAAAAPALAVGTAVRATLRPAGVVTLVPAPRKPVAAGRSGGVFTVNVTAAGRYRVALGGAAWVDVVRDGRAVASVAHGHGPACSSIRKMVDFDLVAARYRLNIADSAAPVVQVMVARLP